MNITPDRLTKWRQALANELIEAHTHFYIWEQLWPTEEAVPALNRFRVFFKMTRNAHVEQFILHVAKVTEHRKDSINLWRLLDAVEQHPNIVPRISTPEVRQQRAHLEADKDILRSIRTHRNKRIAHVDEHNSWPDSPIWQDNRVLFGSAKKLLQDLEDIFNTLSIAHDGQSWSFKPVGADDTSRLLKDLAASGQ